MSHIWRKIREGKDGSKENKRPTRANNTQQLQQKPNILNNHPSDNRRYPNPVSADQHGKRLIPPGIENFFFPAISDEVTDLLLAVPQYVTTLQQVLANPKTRRYFLRYLEGSEKQALAAFWLDVNSLRRSCAQGRPQEAAAAVDVHCRDESSERLEAFVDDVHCGDKGREHLEAAAVGPSSFIKTCHHETECTNSNPSMFNSSGSDAGRSRQQLPDLVNNLSLRDCAVSGRNSTLNSQIDKCFCDTGSRTCGRCVAAIRLGNRLADDCLNDNNRLVCDTQPNFRSNVNVHCDKSTSRVDNASCMSSTLKRNYYCDAENNLHETLKQDNDDNEFGDFLSSASPQGTAMIAVLDTSTAGHQNNNKHASTEFENINERNSDPSMQLNCRKEMTSFNKSNPNLNAQSSSPFSHSSGHKTKSDSKCDSATDGSEDAAAHGCGSVTLQHLIKEVWRIFERYIAVDSHFYCPLSESAKRKIIETVGKIHVQFDLNCFTEAQEEALTALQSEVPGFVSSELHLLHQLDLLSYSTTTLPDVLHSHLAFPYFMEYLEQEGGGRPLLEFWMAATNFRNQLKEVASAADDAPPRLPLPAAHANNTNNAPLSCTSSRSSSLSPHRSSPRHTVVSLQSSPRPCSPSINTQSLSPPNRSLGQTSLPSNTTSRHSPLSDQALNEPLSQADAMVVYDKYFSLQAPQQLGFSDGLRCSIESNICRESGPEHTCFDVPLRVVLYVLDTVYMPGYLRSTLYQSYIADLMAAVRTMSGGRRRTTSGSTCSSDVSGAAASAGTSNTLLAVDTSTLGGGVRGSPRLPAGGLPATASSLRIDNSPIQDPDSLWRRHNPSRLSCGAVTPLGRFEPQLLPPPDTVPGAEAANRLTRTLRRLANRDQDKARLEHAYAVAELIVRDVTRVTLDNNNSPLNPYNASNPYDIALSAHRWDSSSFSSSFHPLPSSLVPSAASTGPDLSSASTDICSFPIEPSSAASFYVAATDFGGPQHNASGGWTAHNSVRGSNTNLSTVSTNSSSNSDLRQIPGTTSVYSPTKSVRSTVSKSSSNYNFSDLTDSLFSGFGNTNCLAHSYSLASFDLGTDVDDLDLTRGGTDLPAPATLTTDDSLTVRQ